MRGFPSSATKGKKTIVSHCAVMLLANGLQPDPRVDREARALAEHGYRVSIICWDRRAEFPDRETQHGFEIVRVQNVRSGYAVGWRQLFYLPRFWREATRLALELHPDVIHCHDLDTLYAGRQEERSSWLSPDL